MSKPVFQTAATPTLTADEFKTKQESVGGKWIKDPGTYSLIIKGVTLEGASNFDNQWINFKFTLENSEGQLATHFVEVPTTAANNYMYGAKKSLHNYTKLEKFLKGFGFDLEFTQAIHQLEKLFTDAEKTFVGKTLSVRMGYNSIHTKYLGKDGEVSKYKLVDKDGNPIVATDFAGFEAVDAYAKANNIKVQGFPKVLEVVPAATASIVAGGPAIATALPF